MAKRRASNPEDDSDVDEPEATSPKRARVEEEEEVPEENEEQKQFEARFGEDVRTALEQRNKLAGVSIIDFVLMLSSNPRLLASCGARHNPVSRNAPVHVPSPTIFHIWSTDQLHHRYARFYMAIGIHLICSLSSRPQRQ